MLGIALIALSLLAGSPALAGDPSPAWDDWLAVEGQLGMGTPLGLAGVDVDVTPHRRVSINVGIGRGQDAVQVAAMARVRPLFLGRVFALGLGGGVSRGDTSTYMLFPGDLSKVRFTQATWLNAELFMELRRGRFHLRPFVGVARRVGYSSCVFDDRDTNVGTSMVRPCAAVDSLTLQKFDNIRTIGYTGVAVGFGLL